MASFIQFSKESSQLFYPTAPFSPLSFKDKFLHQIGYLPMDMQRLIQRSLNRFEGDCLVMQTKLLDAEIAVAAATVKLENSHGQVFMDPDNKMAELQARVNCLIECMLQEKREGNAQGLELLLTKYAGNLLSEPKRKALCKAVAEISTDELPLPTYNMADVALVNESKSNRMGAVREDEEGEVDHPSQQPVAGETLLFLHKTEPTSVSEDGLFAQRTKSQVHIHLFYSQPPQIVDTCKEFVLLANKFDPQKGEFCAQIFSQYINEHVGPTQTRLVYEQIKVAQKRLARTYPRAWHFQLDQTSVERHVDFMVCTYLNQLLLSSGKFDGRMISLLLCDSLAKNAQADAVMTEQELQEFVEQVLKSKNAS